MKLRAMYIVMVGTEPLATAVAGTAADTAADAPRSFICLFLSFVSFSFLSPNEYPCSPLALALLSLVIQINTPCQNVTDGIPHALETFLYLSTYTQYNSHDMTWCGALLHTMVL